MTPSTSQAPGKRIKTKNTWWFLTEATLSMEGTNTHGLQICVKQYQGCSRTETGKSRCCPKQNLLEKFNMHNTYQEIGSLHVSREELVASLFPASINEPNDRETEEAEFRPGSVRSLSLVELALVLSFFWRREPATKTRPGLRSRATEKHRNSSAAFPLKRRYYPQQRP